MKDSDYIDSAFSLDSDPFLLGLLIIFIKLFFNLESFLSTPMIIETVFKIKESSSSRTLDFKEDSVFYTFGHKKLMFLDLKDLNWSGLYLRCEKLRGCGSIPTPCGPMILATSVCKAPRARS